MSGFFYFWETIASGMPNKTRSARPDASRLTALERDKPSFPARWLTLNRYLRGEVLDYGCGYGADVAFFEQNELKAQGYDPNFFPDLPDASKKFDRITCSFVFNVLEVEARNLAMMHISRYLKPKGRAYIAVRRDIDQSGFRVVPGTREIVYQANIFLPFKSILQDLSYEIYEYRHYVQLKADEVDRSMIDPPLGYELLAESINAIALTPMKKRFERHAIILPKRKVEGFNQLPLEEQAECQQLADYVVRYHFGEADKAFNYSIQSGQLSANKALSMHVFR